MRNRLGRAALVLSTMGLVLAAPPRAAAGDEKALVGSYALAKRVTVDGKTLTGSAVVGFMTFTKTYRTVIMKWPAPDATPASIAIIAAYTLSGGKYCETVAYGANGNVSAQGVTYDPPSPAPVCTTSISDASGLELLIPGEGLRLRVMRDGIIATAPLWTDYWEKVK